MIRKALNYFKRNTNLLDPRRGSEVKVFPLVLSANHETSWVISVLKVSNRRDQQNTVVNSRAKSCTESGIETDVFGS